MIRHRLLGASAALFAVCSAANAFAQDAKGFSLDRFDPAERGSDWFTLDSLDLRGHRRTSAGDVTEFAYKPLVIYNGDGSERAAIVKLQSFTHVGASIVMWDRARFGFNLPVLFWQKGETGNIGSTNYQASNNSTVGDLRLSGDVLLYGKYRDPLTIAAGLALYVPTGDRASYTGDEKLRVSPRVLAAGEYRNLAWAGRLSIDANRQGDSFAGNPMGTEVSFGLAAGVRAFNAFLFGPELYGSTGVSNGDAVFAKASTPLELLFGAHYRLAQDLHVDLGFGPGITKGYGTPLMRGVISIEWVPKYEPPATSGPVDRDSDGIADTVDACPTVPGIWTDEPSTNGCPPPPPDRDRDGVIDAEDACIDVPGVATQDPKTNGCPPPPPDRDGDGVIDAEDACIDVPGVATQDPKTNGCPPPPPDRDNDTILDPEDACPDHAGPKDPDPKKNGCPIARVEAGQIRITQQVKFKFGSAVLDPESDGVLGAVLDILQKHPEITKIRVEGHTDNHGADWLNLGLSKQRAASVVAWLAKKGIKKERMESEGYGKTRPIDTNDTPQGMANNRRVEFHIVEPKQLPAAPTTPSTAPAKPPAPVSPTQPGAAPATPASPPATSPSAAPSAPAPAAPAPAASASAPSASSAAPASSFRPPPVLPRPTLPVPRIPPKPVPHN